MNLMPNSNNEQYDEIYLIIEHYHKKENKYVFDFAGQSDFIDFIDLLDLDEPMNVEGASMLEMVNSQKKKRFSDGTYYKLNRKWIRENKQRFNRRDNSTIICFEVDLTDDSITSFFYGSGKRQTYYELNANDPGEVMKLLDGQWKHNGNNPFDKLTVRYVGQGSWNEFSRENLIKVVFDIGTIYTASKTEVITYMRTRDQAYQLSKPVLILSHWDVDHYHMLLEAEDATIQSFTYFIFRNVLPNATSYRVLQRFRALNNAALMPVAAEVPHTGKTSKKVKRLTKGPYLHLYNGSRHWDRNVSGMMLSFQNLNVAAVCPADSEYQQIQGAILPQLNHKHHHYLVVPHHGGEAGKITYRPIPAITKKAIISVGKDKIYGHPKSQVIQTLRDIGFHVTNFQFYHNDYEIPLKRT